VAFTATLEQAARGVEGEALANAAEDVGEITVLRARIAHPAGRHQWQPQALREVDEDPVAVFLGAKTVSLQLDVEAFRKDAMKVLEFAFGGVEAAVNETLSDHPFGAAGETEETVGVGLNLVPSGTGLALGSSTCGLGEQAAEVAVAATITGQEREARKRRPRWGRVRYKA
jgi:hypothetical protein